MTPSLVPGDRVAARQAMLVAAWLVASAATIVAVIAAGDRTNALGAQARARMGIDGPVLLVMNDGDSPWTDVTYTLDGRYVFSQAALEPGGVLTVAMHRFHRGGAGGPAAPRDLAPRVLDITCAEGAAHLVLIPQAGR